MFSDQLPHIVSWAFLLAFLFPVSMVAKLAQRANIVHGFKWVFGFYVIYLTAVSLASMNGFFNDSMLPPKIVLTTTLPLGIFLIFIYNTAICKKATDQLSLNALIGIHIFRLIGSTFLILFFYDLLPAPFAVFAGIGDLLTAITSLFVVRAIKNDYCHARKLAYIWNTLGLLDILITSALAIIFTKISMDTGDMGVEFLAQFPFCFIPAFAPPTIIFLHLLVYRKLSQEKK